MASNMKSKTKVVLSEQDLNNICQTQLHTELLSSREITSGFYNAIYELKTKNNSFILKVAPSLDIDIMTYEKDIMKREIKVYRLLQNIHVPVPKVIAIDDTKSIIASDFYIMEQLEGNTLFELKENIIDKERYYKMVMEYLSKIHQIKMDAFGYDNLRVRPVSNSDAMLQMFDNIYQDGVKKNIVYPTFIIALLDRIKDYKLCLDEVKRPSLLHFDLWDGNIFVHQHRVVGLIDTERSFNGDPLAEFAGMHLDIFADENRTYLEHYNLFANEKIIVNDNARIRFRIYQTYMYFLMYVECAFRDINGSFDGQKQWSLEMLKKCYDILK